MQVTWNGNGRDDEIEVDAGGWYVTFKQGESKDVPDELANGTPQQGEVGDEDYQCAKQGLIERGDFSASNEPAPVPAED